MLKLGFKAAHYMSSNNVGVVVNIERKSNNQLTIGGTTEARVFITLEYTDKDGSKSRVVYPSGDLLRVYE